LHWPSVVGGGEYHRLISTVCCFGGNTFSFGTLMAMGMFLETVAPLEVAATHSIGRHAFPTALIVGAATLLLSQYYGVWLRGWQELLQCGQHCPGRSYWLSHDLVFLLFCVSCWLQPADRVTVSFIPGLPPMPRWTLPFIWSGVHVLLSSSLQAIYIEAIAMSVPTALAVTASQYLQCPQWMGGGAGREWQGGWTRPDGRPHQA
jgi:hypothetical protein